jgi:Amt family ammonium transporter
MLAWLAAERIRGGHATTLGAASGAVAGLVAITPCAGYVSGMAPVAIGAVAGLLCFFAIRLKFRFGFDDSLDVIGVHLVGGIVGSLLLGLFADKAFGGALFGGGTKLLVNQFIAVGSTIAYSGTVSLALAFALHRTIGLRVSREDEYEGLDLSQHAETAYAFTDFGSRERLG